MLPRYCALILVWQICLRLRPEEWDPQIPLHRSHLRDYWRRLYQTNKYERSAYSGPRENQGATSWSWTRPAPADSHLSRRLNNKWNCYTEIQKRSLCITQGSQTLVLLLSRADGEPFVRNTVKSHSLCIPTVSLRVHQSGSQRATRVLT